MCERYDAGIKAYMRNIRNGEFLANNPEVVEFTNDKIKLSGLLVDRSLIIPISVAYAGNEMLTKMVESNIKALKEKGPKESVELAVCHVLGLPYNGQTKGLRSHGENFNLIGGIHFYPDDEIASEPGYDFINHVKEALASVGSEISMPQD